MAQFQKFATGDCDAEMKSHEGGQWLTCDYRLHILTLRNSVTDVSFIFFAYLKMLYYLQEPGLRTGYSDWLHDGSLRGRSISVSPRISSSPSRPALRSTQAFYPMGTGDTFRGGKAAEA